MASLKRLLVLMGTVFVDMMGFSLVLTQLPYYAQTFGATPTVIGLLISSFAIAQLTTAPFWGRFSDRYGRRPAILSGLGLSALAFLLFAVASSPEAVVLFSGLEGAGGAGKLNLGALALLLLSRLVQGAGGGTISVVQAYVTDASEPEQRSQALGWVTAATSAGVMIGPTIGSLAVRLGPSAPGYVAAGLCLVAFSFAWRWLPESFPRHPAGDEPAPRRPSLRKSFIAVLTQPSSPVARLIWTYALGMLAFMSLNGVLVLYLERAFGITEENIGWFYAYVAGVTLIMRAVLLGIIVRKLGEVWTLRLGAVCVALGLLLIPSAHSIPALALVAAFMPIGTALLFPVTTSMVSQRFGSRETGQALGVQQAFGGLARLIGPIWATIAFERLGITSPFLIAGALMVLVALHTLRIEVPPRAKPDAEAIGEDTAADADGLGA